MKKTKQLLLRAGFLSILASKYGQEVNIPHGWREKLIKTLPLERWPITVGEIVKNDCGLLFLSDRDLTEIINAWFNGIYFAETLNNIEEVSKIITDLISETAKLTDVAKEEVFEWLFGHEVKEKIMRQINERKI